MDLILVLGMGVRVATVVLGVLAFLYLTRVRTLKGSGWNRKMKDIWWAHLIGVYAVTQANVEYFFRQELPSLSGAFFIFLMIWTIRGVRSGDMYTNETPVCVHPNLHPDIQLQPSTEIRLLKR